MDDSLRKLEEQLKQQPENAESLITAYLDSEEKLRQEFDLIKASLSNVSKRLRVLVDGGHISPESAAFEPLTNALLSLSRTERHILEAYHDLIQHA